MSQNPEPAERSKSPAVPPGSTPAAPRTRRDPATVSDGAAPPISRSPRRDPSRSSVATSELDAYRSGPGGPTSGDGRPQMSAPPPAAVRQRSRPVQAPPTAGHRRRQPRQPRPTFRGPRLADFIGWWRRLRSIVFLIVITVILGMILAAIVAVAVGAIVVSIQHALKSG
jgi:hypothetical protein